MAVSTANIDPALKRLRNCQILSVGIGFIAIVAFQVLGFGSDATETADPKQESFNNTLPTSGVDSLCDDKLAAISMENSANGAGEEDMDENSFDLLGKAEEQQDAPSAEEQQLARAEAVARAETERLEAERDEGWKQVNRQAKQQMATAKAQQQGSGHSSFNISEVRNRSNKKAYQSLQNTYGTERFPNQQEETRKPVKEETKPTTVATAQPSTLTTVKKKGFNTVTGSKAKVGHDIRAVVHGTHQNLTTNSMVKLRLLDPMVIDGTTIPPNSFVYGRVSFSEGRVQISIDNVNYKDNVLPFQGQIYDQDGGQGIYVPGNVISDAGKEAGGSAASGSSTNVTSSRSGSLIQTGVHGINSGINAVKNAVNKKVTENKVSISANYKVTIRQKKK